MRKEQAQKIEDKRRSKIERARPAVDKQTNLSDPFESIISECIISPTMEEALNHAPEIGERCFSSIIFTLHGPNAPCLFISSEDFEALIRSISQNPTQRSLGRHDILKMIERKGLPLSKPKWWHPDGYDKVCLHFTQGSN